MRLRIFAAAAVLLAGCSSGSKGSGTRHLAFPAVTVPAGADDSTNCQSITLHNDQPIYVSSVTMNAGPAWHHSNWFFVPDTSFDGPDGTWTCNDRSWDEFAAAVQGGILFAQSTQIQSETQAFPAGSAVRIPPHSRVIGDEHVLNASSQAVTTAISLDLVTVPLTPTLTQLQPLVLEYHALDLPPQARSRFTGRCDVAGQTGGTMDFRFYYALAHYHGFGRGMHVVATNGAGTEAVYDTTATIGQDLGGTLDPPVDTTGKSTLDFTCEYDNTTTNPLYWGNGGGEMCMMLAFTDSPHRWYLHVDAGSNMVVGTDGQGVVENEGPCGVYRFDPP